MQLHFPLKMHFFGISQAGLLVLFVICHLVTVAAQENVALDSKIVDVTSSTESAVTGTTSAAASSSTEKTSPSEVSFVSPSSTAATQTPTPKTVTDTPQPSPVSQKDIEKPPSCVLLAMDGLLSLKYFRKDDVIVTQNVSVTVADDFNGCPFDVDVKKPRIFSHTGPSVTFNFTVKQRTDGSRWYVGSIKILYNPADLFANKTFENLCELKTSSDEYFMETPLDRSFACSEPRSIAFYTNRGKPGAQLMLKKIQLQVYDVPKDGKMAPEFLCGENLAQPVPTELQDTVYRSDTVPIVVGSCLAVITFLVISGYAIYRSLTVKKLDYATMEE